MSRRAPFPVQQVASCPQRLARFLWQRSLFWQLLLLFLLVVIVAIITMGLSANWLEQHALKQYSDLNATQQDHAQALASTLHTALSQQQPAEALQAMVEHQGQTWQVRILLVNVDRQVVADSLRAWLGAVVNPPIPANVEAGQALKCSDLFHLNATLLLAYRGNAPPCAAPFTILGLAGTAFGDPVGVTVHVQQGPQRVILASFNDILILAMLIGGITAFLVAVLVAFMVLTPLKTLTRAAYRLEQGDLEQQVRVSAGGELAQLARAFNQMVNSLKRSERLRRQMVSDVAHELRTPLTTIQAYLDAIADGVVAPEEPILASLQEEALLLGRLVVDLQELSLAEAGQLSLACAPLALEECLAPVVQGLQAQARAQQVTIRLDLSAEVPLVEADRARVGQVLRNLLTNALKHTPAGGTIFVSASVLGQEVQISVQDTGVGIEPRHLPYLFERFYRADASRSRQTGGTGLGLAIVKHLVQAQGGQVGVESAPGQGARFFFTLPAAAAKRQRWTLDKLRGAAIQ